MPKLLALGLIALLAAPSTAATQGAAPPANLVVFLVDDLGWSDTAVAWHPAQEAMARPFATPAIAALAARGAIFSDAHAASPVCSPSRAALLTGLHPARTRITDWIGHCGPTTQPAPGPKLLHRLGVPAWREDGLDSREHRTLAQHLQANGYRTLHVGKWHLGRPGQPGADPLACGFDRNIGGTHLGSPGSHLAARGYANAKGQRRVPGIARHAAEGHDLATALTLEALQEIDVAKAQPFFLHLALYAVHTPLEATSEELAQVAAEDLSPKQRVYAAMVQRVDRALARLVAGLEARGLLGNTVICFTSDNGPLTAHSGPPTTAAPLKGGKGTAHEGGTRVPLIIAGPRVPASRHDKLVRATDLAPTLNGLLRAPVFVTPDGRDLSEALVTAEAAGPGAPMLTHYPHSWWRTGGLYDVPGIEPFTAWRDGPWRLIWFWNGPRLELYHLEEDLGESKDLARAAEHAATRAGLLGAMVTRLKELDAQRPIDRESGQALPWPDLDQLPR